MSMQQRAAGYRRELLPYSVPCAADNDNLINVLLVEDDYSDTLLTIQKINATSIPYNLDRITHGDDVLPYLGNCAQTRLPDIMLLDLGLPGADGFDVLQALMGAPAALRAVPIAVITGLRDLSPMSSAYRDLPIWGCLAKPVSVDDLLPILSKALPN
ncbi:MAG: response regulator [Alphaproteobacteria bacterium]|nr:response regulator [Alphaproteobacteria bacterium]